MRAASSMGPFLIQARMLCKPGGGDGRLRSLRSESLVEPGLLHDLIGRVARFDLRIDGDADLAKCRDRPYRGGGMYSRPLSAPSARRVHSRPSGAKPDLRYLLRHDDD